MFIYIHVLSIEFRQASQIETIPLKELNEGEETHGNGYSRKTNGASSSAAWSSGTELKHIIYIMGIDFLSLEIK